MGKQNGATVVDNPPAAAPESGAHIAPEEIILPEIQAQEARVRIESLTPLICHNWSEKAKKQMRDKQQGRATGPREAKNPQQEFESSLYVVPGHEDWPIDRQGRYYFPATAFKSAIVTGCRFATGITLVQARSLIFMPEDPIIEFDELVMREDPVRISTTTDLHYRGEFRNWGADLRIQYNAGMLSLEQLVNMVNLGGFHSGIGEWRPASKRAYNGEFGRFRVKEVRQ